MGALADQALATAQDLGAIAGASDVFTSAGLVIGSSSAAAVKIANTVTYKILGDMFSKTTAEIAFTASAANNIAVGSEQVYMLQLDYAGNGLLIPGAPALAAGQALLPERPGATLMVTTAAIVANAAAQTVPISVFGDPLFNGSNLAVSSVVNVDKGLNAENVTVTAVVPPGNNSVPASISGIFADNHPVGTIIQQGFSPIGYVRIFNGSASTVFTAGTTLLSATGLTVTYTNGYRFPLFQAAQ